MTTLPPMGPLPEPAYFVNIADMGDGELVAVCRDEASAWKAGGCGDIVFPAFTPEQLTAYAEAERQQVAAAKDQEVAHWKAEAFRLGEIAQRHFLTHQDTDRALRAAESERDALMARVAEVVRQMDTDERGKPYVYTKPSMVIWTEKWRGWVAMLREVLPAAPQHEGEK